MDETPDTTHDHTTHPVPAGQRTPRSHRAAPILGLALVVALSGAATLAVTSAGGDGGGPGDDRSSAPAGDRSPQEDAALAFADCMRDNGIEDFPDPEVDEDGGISIGDALADQRDTADFQAAEDACEPALDAAAPAPQDPELPPDQVAELQDQWLAVADCVRAQGHEIDDPHVDDYGRPQIQVESQDVEQALEDCIQLSDLSQPPGDEAGSVSPTG
jgi:hypothetical protein